MAGHARCGILIGNKNPFYPSQIMQDYVRQKFLEAYDAYADAIFRHCYFRVFVRSRAEELMQETFMKTWEYLAGGKSIENIRAFLYRVANNLIIDEARKHKEVSLEALLENEKIREPADNAPENMERNLESKELLRILHALPQEHREVLVLRYVNDLDPKEIGEVLGITVNAASVRIHRALAMLKDRANIDTL